MVTSTVPGTVAVPVETLVSPVAAPVADVSPVAAFNPWEDDEDGSLPGSVVTSYGIKMKSAETA